MSETKKPRALPHVWAPFHTLSKGAGFFLGTNFMTKTSFITARVTPGGPGGQPYGNWRFVYPFRRVKTNRLVRDARPGGKSSSLVGAIAMCSPSVFPAGAGETIRSVNCEGNLSQATTVAEVEAGVGVSTPEHLRSIDIVNAEQVSILGDQPHSVNGVSGPTA